MNGEPHPLFDIKISQNLLVKKSRIKAGHKNLCCPAETHRKATLFGLFILSSKCTSTNAFWYQNSNFLSPKLMKTHLISSFFRIIFDTKKLSQNTNFLFDSIFTGQINKFALLCVLPKSHNRAERKVYETI